MFAEAIQKRRARIDSQIVFLSVYTQGNRNCVLDSDDSDCSVFKAGLILKCRGFHSLLVDWQSVRRVRLAA